MRQRITPSAVKRRPLTGAHLGRTMPENVPRRSLKAERCAVFRARMLVLSRLPITTLLSTLNGGLLPWQDAGVEHFDCFDFCALCG